MIRLFLSNDANPNAKAKNGLTAIHLCAQEDRANVAGKDKEYPVKTMSTKTFNLIFTAILSESKADLNSVTKAGYTPLHVACHFGGVSMVRFLLDHNVKVDIQVPQKNVCFKDFH